MAALALALCGCSARPSTEEAARLALVFAPRFEEFERWSDRALAAETVSASVDEFQARLFAPVQDERDVVDAWMARTGTSPFAASAHGGASPVANDAMATVRVPDHGSLRIGVGAIDDPRTAAVDSIDVVVVERTRRLGPTEEVSYAVAFARR